MGYPAAVGLLMGLLLLGGCSLFPERERSDDSLMLEESALMATVTADGDLVFYRMEPSRAATGQGSSRSRHKMLGFDGGTQTVLAAAHRLDDTETQSLMQRLMAVVCPVRAADPSPLPSAPAGTALPGGRPGQRAGVQPLGQLGCRGAL